MDTITFHVTEKTIHQRKQILWIVIMAFPLIMGSFLWLLPEFRIILTEPTILVKMGLFLVLAMVAVYFSGMKWGLKLLRQFEVRLTPDAVERHRGKNKEQFTYHQINRFITVKNRAGDIVRIQLKTPKTTISLGELENMELLATTINQRIGNQVERRTKTAWLDWATPLSVAFLFVVVWVFILVFLRTQGMAHLLLLQLFIFLLQAGWFLFAKPFTQAMGQKYRLVEYLVAGLLIGYCLFAFYFFWPDLWQGPCGLPQRYLQQSGCILTFEAGESVAFLPEGQSLLLMPFEEDDDDSRIVELVPLDSQPSPAITTWQQDDFLAGFSLSADGKRLLAWTEYHELWLWDVETGEALIQYDDQRLENVVITPDSRILASHARNILTLWDTNTWQLLTTINQVRSVAFSPDGSLMATCPVGSENVIDLWQVDDFSFVRSLSIPGSLKDELCWSISFSPDGKYVAAVEYSREVYVWRVSDGVWQFTWEEPASPSTPPVFSADGHMMAAGFASSSGRNGYVKIWSMDDGSLLATVPSGENVIYRPESVAFSPDNSLLAVANFREVLVFDMAKLLP